MRIRSMTVLCAFAAVFAASPAFAQMTQQNRPNQGNAAHPPKPTSAKQGNATGMGQSGGSASGSHVASGSEESSGATQGTKAQ